jgi:hypothetical protein
MTSKDLRQDRRNRVSPEPPGGHRADLVVLVVLLALSTVLYSLAGPAGLSAIISAAVGLYLAWRGRQ